MKLRLKYISAFVIFATVIVLLIYSQRMKKTYKNEITIGLERTKYIPSYIITENDLEHLPLRIIPG